MSLQDQLKHSQSQFLTIQSQLSSQQLHYNEIQSRVASLQVENATLLSQNASLGSQNESLQTELSRYEARRHADNSELIDMKGQLDVIEQDHDELQRLHDHLTCEHENLLTEHGCLKADCKQAKVKVRELMEQNSTLSREMETVAQVSFQHEITHMSSTSAFLS